MSELPTILIVDDDEIYRSIMTKMVEGIGLPVMTAGDGAEAVTLYKQYSQEIGCVVMDIQMPVMNGIDAFRAMKGIRADVQVIIASGYLNNANQDQLDPLNPAGYLKKPFDFSDLSEMLEKCLPFAGTSG